MSALTNTFYMHIQHISLHPHSYEPRITESSIPNRHRWSAELVYKTSMKPTIQFCVSKRQSSLHQFFFSHRSISVSHLLFLNSIAKWLDVTSNLSQPHYYILIISSKQITLGLAGVYLWFIRSARDSHCDMRVGQ